MGDFHSKTSQPYKRDIRQETIAKSDEKIIKKSSLERICNEADIKKLTAGIEVKLNESIKHEALIDQNLSDLRDNIKKCNDGAITHTQHVTGIRERDISSKREELNSIYKRFYEVKGYQEKYQALQDYSKNTEDLSDIVQQLELGERFMDRHKQVLSDTKSIEKIREKILAKDYTPFTDIKPGEMMEMAKNANSILKEFRDMRGYENQEFRDTHGFEYKESIYEYKKSIYEKYIVAASQLSDAQQKLSSSQKIIQGLSDSQSLTRALASFSIDEKAPQDFYAKNNIDVGKTNIKITNINTHHSIISEEATRFLDAVEALC